MYAGASFLDADLGSRSFFRVLLPLLFGLLGEFGFEVSAFAGNEPFVAIGIDPGLDALG